MGKGGSAGRAHEDGDEWTRWVGGRWMADAGCWTALPRAERDSPVGIPSDTEPDDVFVREEGPEEVQAEEEISRRPRNESVKFWGPAADFRRG